MAKKKTTNKPQPQLSPANYIKQAARKVPVYECLINEGWEEGGMAQIFVARKKQHGNIILGVYIVDTFCLGLKNTMFQHNMSEYEYEQHKKEISRNTSMEWEKLSPNTCFNIIYGAIEYAEDLGFMPNKDFSTTEYILDDVETLKFEDIEFGRDGKPYYFAGPYDDTNRVIAKLKKAVGEGNFEVTMPVGGFNDNNDDDFDKYVRNEYEDDDFDDDDEYEVVPCISILVDFKEDITAPEKIVADFVKKHQSTINIKEDGRLPFINIYPNEEEMKEKYVDKDIIKVISSFFKEQCLNTDSIYVHVDIEADALLHREDELFAAIFNTVEADLIVENKNLNNYLDHFPQITKDKEIVKCIQNNHLFAYIEKVYTELKKTTLEDDYVMKLSVALCEENDDAPMRFIVSISVEDKNYE